MEKLTAACFLCGLIASTGGWAQSIGSAEVSSGQTYTALEDGIQHATKNCGGAIVTTPRSGTQFQAKAIAMPAGMESFYAKAARLKVTWYDTMECVKTGKIHSPIASGSSYSNITDSVISSNWSGYQIGSTGQFVQAGWFIPTVQTPNPGYSSNGYYSSVWPGIGGGFGANGGPLIQSGSEQELNAGGGASYYFWYEIVGGPTDTTSEVQISPPAAHAGDEVGAVTQWVADANTGTGTVSTGVCNFTNGGCVHFNIPGTPAPGNTVEWIVEAPSSFNGPLPIADFTTVFLRNACWAASAPIPSGVCQPITAGQTLTAIDLQQNVLSGPQILSSPGAIGFNGTGFDVTYYPPH